MLPPSLNEITERIVAEGLEWVILVRRGPGRPSLGVHRALAHAGGRVLAAN